MTATDELRRMLDERGVEYKSWVLGSISTIYQSSIKWIVIEDKEGLALAAYKDFLTPEQTVKATLGAGTCKADETETMECVCDGIGHYGEPLTVHVMECSACGGTYEYVNGSYEYCPRCGAKVVDE